MIEIMCVLTYRSTKQRLTILKQARDNGGRKVRGIQVIGEDRWTWQFKNDKQGKAFYEWMPSPDKE